jgi:GR25 family glycosyltransferase involved in LPS biosynthesis
VQVDASSKARRIKMTPQEIAVALSHIEVWKLVAVSNVPYTLILEDDVYFRRGFTQSLDAAWLDIINHSSKGAAFDILFLSFQEVGISSKVKMPQTRLVHKPDRGIWQASGYVLSREGAQKLLNMLPVYGPVDLWLNLQFDKLEVLLTKRPIIEQRVDVPSTNSYSVMPVLSQIGVYTHEKPLVTQTQKLPGPMFAFGKPDSGLTALAMALSIIGYTCCSDITELPTQENNNLITKGHGRHFNAYVNIGSFSSWSINDIIKLYPNARFIFTTLDNTQISILNCRQMLYLPNDHQDKWEELSTFFKCEYPTSPYPTCNDIGQQIIAKNFNQDKRHSSCKQLKFDSSPWIISSNNWGGIAITKASSKK